MVDNSMCRFRGIQQIFAWERNPVFLSAVVTEVTAEVVLGVVA